MESLHDPEHVLAQKLLSAIASMGDESLSWLQIIGAIEYVKLEIVAGMQEAAEEEEDE